MSAGFPEVLGKRLRVSHNWTDSSGHFWPEGTEFDVVRAEFDPLSYVTGYRALFVKVDDGEEVRLHGEGLRVTIVGE